MNISSSAPKNLLIACNIIILLLLVPFSICSSSIDQTIYIVRVDHESMPSVFPTPTHWYESSLTSLALSTSKQIDDNVASSGRIIYTYNTVLHGFAARLSAEEARKLESINGVLSVVPQQVRQLQTTHSPEFLGLKRNDNTGLLKESDYGSNIIIGIIDTGIWPERESFHDRGLGPIPSKWKGECVDAADFPARLCNRKLIGAKYFNSGLRFPSPENQTSPRDYHGHGTSTASIAAGRYVSSASLFGYAEGVAVGMAPMARLAVYKACWIPENCADSDILAAFEAAVADGVDIISISINTGLIFPYHMDLMAVGAFGASDAGIFVSASAGNYGTWESTVNNIAPWVTTVGAGSMDRDFPAEVKLGNGKIIQGLSIYSGPGLEANKVYPLSYPGNVTDEYDTSYCDAGSLDPYEVKGTIVICHPGASANVEKGEVVKDAGGVGMILANTYFSDGSIEAESHVLPTVSVNNASITEIRKYMISALQKSISPTGTLIFKGTKLDVKPAPVVASFSSRGPNPVTVEILKPELIAPGLNILAAWTGSNSPSLLPSNTRRTEFNIMSGTSMACPHVAGIAAMLKSIHPKWSPAAIRSALMTTAYSVDNSNQPITDVLTKNPATAMDFGAGHVNPQKAMDPGLIYDLTSQDYVAYLCNMNYTPDQIQTITRKYKSCSGVKRSTNFRNFNYPSLVAAFNQHGKKNTSVHFDRTVTNVGDSNSVYKAIITAPTRTSVTVKPNKIAFKSVGEKLSFHVRVEAEALQLSPGSKIVKSGSIVWSDGKHLVNSPLVLMVKEPSDD